MEKTNQSTKPAKPADPEQLLTIMSFQEEDKESAQTAFAEFVRLFEEFIRKIVHYIMNRFAEYNEHDKQTMIHNTLFKAYEKAHTYKHKPSAKRTSDQQYKAIEAWLATIAKNEILMIHQTNTNNPDVLDNAYPLIEDHEPPDLSEEEAQYLPHPMKKILIKEFNKARKNIKPNYLEAVIMMLESENEKGEVPKSMKDLIRDKYGFNPAYLRKIKERTIEQLQNNISPEFAEQLITKYYGNEKFENIRERDDKAINNLAEEYRSDDPADSGARDSLFSSEPLQSRSWDDQD